MFLLASLCHVGAHPGEHQHGVSIQISISLGKTFLQIPRLQNIPLTWILARVFVLCTSFHFPDSVLYLYFILIYFEWRDTENQQLWERDVTHLSIPWWLRMYRRNRLCLVNNKKCRLWLPFEAFKIIPKNCVTSIETIVSLSLCWLC